MTDVSVAVEGSKGVRTLDFGSTITIETKQTLTPAEKRRKNVIILLIITLIFMVAMSTIGILLPQAGIGRVLILLSELPAFGFSLTFTQLLLKKKKEPRNV
ncbi:MAG TPA: hypothetical protein VFF30_05640 [Nitrososphaerales archaeon]|nr:hypothetical protein [Nitrososphaerales archaeon]